MNNCLVVVLLSISLGLLLWIAIMQLCQPRGPRPVPKKHKFFMTTAPEFATVYIDWSYKNASILGDDIPFQTVQLTPTEDRKVFFKFTGKDDSGNDVPGDGRYDRLLDQVLLLFGDNSLELHSSSPKNLLENVQAVYAKRVRNFSRQ